MNYKLLEDISARFIIFNNTCTLAKQSVDINICRPIDITKRLSHPNAGTYDWYVCEQKFAERKTKDVMERITKHFDP
jgi:hypothetical protein